MFGLQLGGLGVQAFAGYPTSFSDGVAAPSGYHWEFVTDDADGSLITDDVTGQPIVDLVVN